MLLGVEGRGGFCSPRVKNSWQLVKGYEIILVTLDLLGGITDLVKIRITCIKLLL
jgi:hypothetical protein